MRVSTALCATRRYVIERRWKGSAVGLSQQSDEAGGSPIPEARVRVGAAPTRARRVGTTGRPGARLARREGVTEVNQWLNPLKRDAGSNLVDVGRIAAHAVRGLVGGDSEADLMQSVGRPRGRSAAYSWRCCRGRAGRRPRRSRRGERGNRPGVALAVARWGGGGQARCRLMAPGRDGGSVVVRGRESRSHGEGIQRVSGTVAGTPGGRR